MITGVLKFKRMCLNNTAYKIKKKKQEQNAFTITTVKEIYVKEGRLFFDSEQLGHSKICA